MKQKTRLFVFLLAFLMVCGFVLHGRMQPELPPQEPDTTQAEAPQPDPMSIPPDSTFSIRFINVGQGDAALVECDGHYMLIDGGNKGDSQKIYSILRDENVSTLDIVVASHAHEDHIGGLLGAFSYTTSALTLCPVTSYDSDAFRDFQTYADKCGGGITVPEVGDTYNLGHAAVEILGVNSTTDDNDCSIVLMITYGSTRFLFTGDAERGAEQAILASGVDLSATVLKVGHHGGDTSTTYPFLREIMPQYAVVSVGTDNAYGHPTEDVLSRLRDAAVQVFRTDLQGDIFCSSDGEDVSFAVSCEEPTVPETETADCDYILNTNTKKFHIPSCNSVRQMKEKNKEAYTGSRDALIGMGYAPCGNCKP